jgi:hypothetical protein
MEADKTYGGEIAKVSYTESMKGTVGLRFELALAEEDAVHTMWLTENTTDRVAKTLAEFEVDVKNAEFWKSPGSFLEGKPCSVVTEMKDQKVQIKWFNGPKRAGREASAGAATKAMGLLGVEVPFA